MLRLIPHFKNIKWGLLIAKPHSTNLIYFTQPNMGWLQGEYKRLIKRWCINGFINKLHSV